MIFAAGFAGFWGCQKGPGAIGISPVQTSDIELLPVHAGTDREIAPQGRIPLPEVFCPSPR